MKTIFLIFACGVGLIAQVPRPSPMIGATGGSAQANVPPLASFFTRAGRASTSLTDIAGGGLTFNTGASTVPGGFSLALLSTTSWTFSIQMPATTSASNGVLGLFCADNAGNAVLFHGGLSLTSVSYWTGMQSGGTPSFISAHGQAPAWTVIPQFLQMKVASGTRTFSYSTDGQNWTPYSTDGSTTQATCTRAGFQGVGDGTNFGSLGSIVGLINTTP